MFRKADELLKAGKTEEYQIIDTKFIERLKHYFRASGAKKLGFKISSLGISYRPFRSTNRPTFGNASLEAMTYDKEKGGKPGVFDYIVEKVVLFKVTIDSQNPLKATASLYDVRGMGFNDVFFELKEMEPVLTRDWDLTHPVVSMREAFEDFEKYAFTGPVPTRESWKVNTPPKEHDVKEVVGLRGPSPHKRDINRERRRREIIQGGPRKYHDKS